MNILQSLDRTIGIDIHRVTRTVAMISPRRVYIWLWITIFGSVSAEAHGIDKKEG